MKRLSRLLVLLLILAMMIPYFSITALADDYDFFEPDTDPVLYDRYIENTGNPDNTGYIAFGDSVARGYALPNFQAEGYTIDDTTDHNCRIVHDSYPYIIAKTLGCDTPEDMTDKEATYWPIAQDALTTSFICDLLGIEDGFYDDVYLNTYLATRYNADLYYFGAKGSSFTLDGNGRYTEDAKAYPVDKLISNASVISIGIGMSDILNRARSLAFDDFLKTPDFSNTDALISILKDFVSKMYEGYQRWEANFPLILDYFKENTDATVVIVGAFNPMFGMTITDDIPIPIGTVMSALTNLMNQKYRRWAHEYGYIFVDVSNVDTGSSVNGSSVIEFVTTPDYRQQGKLTHPTKEGYQQMARMVLNALRENEAEEKTPLTTVKVDLGILGDETLNTVDYVAVNGRKLDTDDYAINDHVLAIPYGSIFGRRLTVAAKAADGKISLSYYSLRFSCLDGYIATRLYCSTDAQAVIDTITNLINSAKNTLGKIPNS